MDVRRILLAPDSFKGSLSAPEVCEAMARGVADVLPDVPVRSLPVSDGGEGMLDVVLGVVGGKRIASRVRGPVSGMEVDAAWGMAGDGETAIIEMARAAGLLLVAPPLRDPKVTTTHGVGDLILRALEHGARRVFMGIGGSATNDGGRGMAEALGVRFLGASGTPLPAGSPYLAGLTRIDMSHLDRRIGRLPITVACDVQSPFVGPLGASAVYGPQKGASSEDVYVLDRALSRLRDVILTSLGIDLQSVPGSGAAGGLGGGLVAFCGAALKRGIDVVLDLYQFDRILEPTDLVITGEGRLDAQTAAGKAVAGVARRARIHGVPVIAVVGQCVGERELYVGPDGLDDVAALVDVAGSVEEAMTEARRLIAGRTADLLRRRLEAGQALSGNRISST